MKHKVRESDERLYEIERPSVIESDHIPKDAKPISKFARDIPKGLTLTASICLAGTVLVAVVLATLVQIFVEWSYPATCICIVVGLPAVGYSGMSITCHYAAVCGCNPCVVYQLLIERVEARRRWFRTFTKKIISPAYFWLVVLAALFSLCVASNIDIGPKLESHGLSACFFVVPIGLGMAWGLSLLVNRYYIAIDSRFRRKLWDEVVKAFNAYFQPDYDSRIPYAFRSPQGPLANRVLIFFVGPFLLALALGGAGNLLPIGPALMSEESLADLAMDHPYQYSEEFDCPDPDVRMQTQEDLRDFSYAEIIADGDQPEGEEKFSLYTRRAAMTQLDLVKHERNAWIHASWRHLSNRVFLMLAFWLGSLLQMYVVVFCGIVGMLVIILPDDTLRRSVALQRWLDGRNELDYRTYCQLHSSDPYEPESVFLGEIIDLQDQEEL